MGILWVFETDVFIIQEDSLAILKRKKSFFPDQLSLSITWGYRALQGFTEGCNWLQGVTGGYDGLQGFTGGYKG